MRGCSAHVHDGQADMTLRDRTCVDKLGIGGELLVGALEDGVQRRVWQQQRAMAQEQDGLDARLAVAGAKDSQHRLRRRDGGVQVQVQGEAGALPGQRAVCT